MLFNVWPQDQQVLLLQTLRPCPRPTKWETLGMGPSSACVNKPSWWFWCALELETMNCVLFSSDWLWHCVRQPHDTEGNPVGAFGKGFCSPETLVPFFPCKQLCVKVLRASAPTHHPRGSHSPWGGQSRKTESLGSWARHVAAELTYPGVICVLKLSHEISHP